MPLPRDMLSEAIVNWALKEVTFGVRPENLTLGGSGMPVTVDLVEELGADSFVHGHAPDGGPDGHPDRGPGAPAPPARPSTPR